MPTDERWIVFGRTSSGKTSLARKIIEEFQKANPTAVTQVLDPKMQSENVGIVRTMNFDMRYDQRTYDEFLRFKMD